MDARRVALTAWVNSIDTLANCEPTLASGDASFRRYFRLQVGSNSFIVMDAPPERENCLPFLRVAGYLEAMRLNAPRVIEVNLDDGFLLLSDLGTLPYLDALQRDPDLADSLYEDAIAALLTMQRRGTAYQASLPPYDDELLRFELSLFRDWLCGTHLGLSFSASDEAQWQACCDVLTANVLQQPQVFVHRDYHSRNLMVTDEDNPGILDFQDAVEGPLTYDLVSLLKDCYVCWPAEQIRQWALAFYRGLDRSMRERVDELQFRRYFELTGVQRHLKAAGIFARLNHRDGKPAYLADVPRTLSYIVALGSQYEELQFLAGLIEARVLPALRDAP
ncbi:MAG: phosphotransferase [Gammaproteobacteria bacterium]|nr:phosphotransferase [Gammaproteobacteria bacterium]MBU2675534.1 phosphotransferase [Gammaproteobacteria bacterium]NNC57271.1 phosphotransferase [Woeseiaceae bacterium]NNL49269.1 phosphotransferase [Woeseiaceae bacterium]